MDPVGVYVCNLTAFNVGMLISFEYGGMERTVVLKELRHYKRGKNPYVQVVGLQPTTDGSQPTIETKYVMHPRTYCAVHTIFSEVEADKRGKN